MKKISLIYTVAIILVLVGTLIPMGASSQPTYQFSSTERQLTTSTADQFDPAISGSYAVYSDRRNGDADIYLYNLDTNAETQITSGGGDQLLPDIYGTKVVYTDFGTGNADVVLYDILTGQTTRLTNDPANQRNPAISGNRVVYEDDRTALPGVWMWQIYMVDLNTMTETPLTNDPGRHRKPAVSGSNVVYEDYLNGNSEIVLFDLNANVETNISNNPAQELEPDLDGDIVVLSSTRASIGDIYYYRISTGETVAVTNTVDYERNPSVSGDYISYESLAAGNSDVWLYSIPMGVVAQATTEPDEQYLNDLSGNRLVYTDNRNGGNLDIYMTEFAFLTPEISVSPGSLYFGEVKKGEYRTQIVTITNEGGMGLTVSSIVLASGSSTTFSITQVPTLPKVIAPGASVDATITFAPTALGSFFGMLQVTSDDPDEGLVEVPLVGIGVYSEKPPEQQIQDILDFFDDSVDDGTLPGDGPGKSAENRRHALRNMIEAAGDLIGNGDIAGACQLLYDTYLKTDGDPQPPDFVKGSAAPELASEILTLMQTLNCPQCSGL
jgi:beta propeller repeat protein